MMKNELIIMIKYFQRSIHVCYHFIHWKKKKKKNYINYEFIYTYI